MTKSYVRTATRSTLKVEANLTQILNFKANFHTEFEPFFKKKIYANNGGHFKIVSIKIKKLILSTGSCAVLQSLIKSYIYFRKIRRLIKSYIFSKGLIFFGRSYIFLTGLILAVSYQLAKAVFKYTLRATTDIEICLCWLIFTRIVLDTLYLYTACTMVTVIFWQNVVITIQCNWTYFLFPIRKQLHACGRKLT